jgi:hypothetical protein
MSTTKTFECAFCGHAGELVTARRLGWTGAVRPTGEDVADAERLGILTICRDDAACAGRYIVRYVLEHPGCSKWDLAKHLDPAYAAPEGYRAVNDAMLAGLIEAQPGQHVGETLHVSTSASCRAGDCEAAAVTGCAGCLQRYCADHVTDRLGRVECLDCDRLRYRQPSWTR